MIANYGRCAQKICLHFARQLGITEKQALGMSTGFGSGMGHADTCGCVSGALMVLGLYHAPDNMSDAEQKALLLNEQMHEFEARLLSRWKSLYCRELLGTDISAHPLALKEAGDKGLFAEICAPLISDTCTILEEMMKYTTPNAKR